MATMGVDVIINVNTGTVQTPAWTQVGGQRSATLNLEFDSANTTSKDSNGWEESDYTIRKWSVEGDGLLEDGDSGFDKLEDAFFNKEQVGVQVAMPTGKTYDGQALLKSFVVTGPNEGEGTASFSLQGTGALAKTTT